MTTPRVSVVIPVLNAEPYLRSLLEAILDQETPVEEILLLDSMSTDRTCEIARGFPQVTLYPIRNFSHGGTRNYGAQLARGEIVALLTQDALPKDRHWLSFLLAPFADPKVAATYSRQIPRPDVNPMEEFFLRTRFPKETVRREKRKEGALDLQSVFFSNVSAAIRRDLLLAYPFDPTLIMSEDQQWARDVIEAGYATVYEPKSTVIHSHDYSLTYAFRRYFDSVYSLTEIFPRHGLSTSAAMGASYLLSECKYIARNYPRQLPYYALYTLAKSAGTVSGHFAEQLPTWLATKLSLNRNHWKKPDRLASE